MKARLIKTESGYYIDTGRLDGLHLACYPHSIDKQKLSLKNCQAIERGYDLDELFDEVEKSIVCHEFDFISFKAGFQKALELMGDKKFTKEQMFNVYAYIVKNGIVSGDEINGYIQSLQQNEWEVEIVREDNFESDGIEIVNIPKPKLDADGCLILKLAK